jgi:pilus assembly protein Flp/PilA
MLHYYLTWLRTLKREEGQDLAEYALLLALIAIAAVGALTALGGQIRDVFNAITAALDAAV